jgi:hypothetical protein
LIRKKRFQRPLVFVLFLLSACGSGGGGEIGPPTVSETNPSDQATNVGVDTQITAKFSSSIDPVTVNDKTFIVVDKTGTVDYRDRTAIFTPSTPFERGRRYNVILTTGIKDLDGIPLRSNFTWAFETEGGPDTTAPEIAATVPRDRETDVSTISSIRVVFSEPIDPASIHQDTFFVNGGVAGTYSYDEPNRTAILIPSRPFPSSTVMTVTVTKEVKDLAGNPLESDLTWSFTTASGTDRTPPRIVTKTPGENATNVSVNSNISMTFGEDIDPVSLQSHFILTGPFGETVPVRLSYSVESRTATFDPEADLAFETRYQVLVTSGVRDLSGNATSSEVRWFFTTGRAPDTTPPVLTARQPEGDDVSVRDLITVTFNEPIKPETLSGNFIVGSNTGTLSGRISYDAASLTASFTPSRPHLEYNTAYTVLLTQGIEDLAGNDLAQMSWTFTTIDPPQVTDMSPVGQEVSTDPLPVIRATFSREMRGSSIHQSSFQVVHPAGAVPGTISYADAVATFIPSIPLLDNTLYRVTLTTGVEDLNGNPLPSNVQWEFHTATPPDPAPRVALTDPADGAVNVSVNISGISAQFQRPIDPSSLLSQFAVRETNGICCLPGRIEYDAGRQRAIFVLTQGPLAHNTSYTAVLGAGIRSTSGTPMGTDHVWTFTTEAAPDTAPPSVVGSDPADGARDIPTTDSAGQPFQIRIDFSEPILASSVNGATFIIRRVESEFDKPEISGAYRTESSSAFFTPSLPYERGKTYEVTLTTGITDLAGNPLSFNVVRSFTTAP